MICRKIFLYNFTKEVLEILKIIENKKNNIKLNVNNLFDHIKIKQTFFNILFIKKNNLLFNFYGSKIITKYQNLKIIKNLLLKKLQINSLNFLKYFIFYYNIKYLNLYFINNSSIIKIKNYINIFNVVIGKNFNLRELEIKEIFYKTMFNDKNNIIIYGNKGVGKFSCIQKYIYKYNKKPLLLINEREFILSLDSKLFFLNEIIFEIKENFSGIVFRKIDLIFKDKNYIDNIYLFLEKLIKNKIIIFGITREINIKENNFITENFSFLKIEELPIREISNLVNDNYISILSNNDKIKFLFTLSKICNNNNSILYIYKNFINKLNLYFKEKKIKINYNEVKEFLYNELYNYIEVPPELFNNINLFSLNIENNIKLNIFGQELSSRKISNKIKLLDFESDRNKPIGGWLLCGISGTGKTELVKVISNVFFKKNNSLIRLDMSEYMEKHSISKLLGSPPGYVGSDSPGILEKVLLKNKFSIILFDEIEKAHKDICNILLQILEEGEITCSSGKKLNLTNTIIFATSNLGSNESLTYFLNKNEKIGNKIIYDSLKKHFKPEILNRFDDIIIFKPLSKKLLKQILGKFLNDYNRINNTNVFISEELKNSIIELSFIPSFGARELKRIFTSIIEIPCKDIINIVDNKNIKIVISIVKNKIIYKILKNTDIVLIG